MLAVRKNRYVILAKDFEKAYKNVVRKQVGGRAGGRLLGWQPAVGGPGARGRGGAGRRRGARAAQ